MAEGVRGLESRSGEGFKGAGDGERPLAEGCGGADNRQLDIEGSSTGKLLSPAKKRRAATEIQEVLSVSERRVCRVLEQPRSTQRLEHRITQADKLLRGRVTELACEYGRYGYRRITSLLRAEGWKLNHKRVERIWRQEGLKVPKKQPKRRRLWLGDSSCLRLRPEHSDHVWSYDCVADRTSNGKPLRMLTVIDEYTRECLAIRIDRKISSCDVVESLGELFVKRGTPSHIRSDNGPEFVAESVRSWLQRLGVKTLFIEPGSPWENGYIESFNGKFRDEFLNGEIFDTVTEARVLTERWRSIYNKVRPHSSLSAGQCLRGRDQTKTCHINQGQVRCSSRIQRTIQLW